MRRHFWTVFGGIWLAVGLPFFLIGVFQWRQAVVFEKEAVRTEAMVLTRDVTPASGNRSTRYSVTYRFEAPDGTVHEGGGDVDVDLWESLQERGPVEIEYLREDPDSHRIAGQTKWVLVYVFCAIGGFFTLAGGGLLFWSVSANLRRSQLMRRGYPAQGEVLRCEPSSLRINHVQQWRAYYRYRDHYGAEHEGKSPYLSPQEGAKWKVGDTVSVRFDPEKPGRSVWLEGE